jgi:hypothetical protein
MRKVFGVAIGVVSLLLISATAFAGNIEGDYVETRSADVYTGPCFANGEVGLTGNQAIIAWKVRRGDWNGVPLAGLSVVAVTRANATLGDVYSDPYPARSVLILDGNATADQRRALVDMARTMGGRLLDDVVRVETAPISMQVGEGSRHGSVELKAGAIASIETRSLGDKDHFCGNEVTYYPPLTELHHAMPAYAISNTYSGNSLGTEWRIFGKRSAFVGTFTR